MNNIRQITNFDLNGAIEVPKTFYDEGSKQMITHTYKLITSIMLGSNNVFKFGYCINNNQGKKYPIYLLLNDEEEIGNATPFYIGKTGMFEFQPEEWTDVNDKEQSEEEIAKVYLNGALVPADVPFCIDYCYSI